MARGKTFSIGLEVKAKHGALLAALEKRRWNQRQGAEFLGIDQTNFSKLINMEKVPRKISEELEIKLFELTGQTSDELWPEEIFTEEFLASSKHSRDIREVPVHLLTAAGAIPALPPPTPEEVYEHGELADALRKALEGLSPRAQHVIRGRFIEEKTLNEIGEEIGVSPSRVQQIEMKALKTLRKPSPAMRRVRKLISL